MTAISIDKKYVFTSVYKTGSASLSSMLTSSHPENISIKHPIFKKTNIDSMFKNKLLVGGYTILNNSQDQTIKPVDISTDSKGDQSSNGVDKNHTNFDCIYSNEVDFVKDV